jgi:hypothetical protein
MPRDPSGNYTLPAGNPVVSGTTIESAWANTTMPDLGDGVTNSLDRQGRGGMLAPLRIDDGAEATPGVAFGTEVGTGMYRPQAAEIAFAIQGVRVATIDSTGFVTSGASFIQRVIITASGNYTPSQGAQLLDVQMVAGGGAGGGPSPTGVSQHAVGAGGGAGEYFRYTVAVSTLTPPIAVVVGAGGVGVAAGDGNVGGATTFNGGFPSVIGGAGGAQTGLVGNGIVDGAEGGQGGIGPLGFIRVPGGGGAPGFASATGSIVVSGTGGASFFGGGTKGRGTDTSLSGLDCLVYGGGGSGGANGPSQAAVEGGNGGPGLIIIDEYT